MSRSTDLGIVDVRDEDTVRAHVQRLLDTIAIVHGINWD
eukprot:SAG31_NODE_5261_length_2644_cov_2.116306_5_plen_39_part_00